MNALKRLTRARAKLVISHPFWATLALQVPLVEDRRCRTGWTDGTKIAYNPDYIESLSESAVISFVGHEVAHPAFLHHLRVGKRDRDLFNRAADYAVNLILKDSGFEFPSTWLCDEKYRGMSAEEIYRLLQEAEASKPRSGGDAGGSSDGEEDAGETGEPGDTGKPETTQDEPEDEDSPETGSGEDPEEESADGTPGDEEGDQETGPGTGLDPGDADEEEPGETGDDEETDDTDYGPGEVREFPGDVGKTPSESQRREEEIAWKTRVSQAAEIARARGDLPGALDRFVKDLITPRVNWRSVLASFMAEALDEDYSWRTPNTRYAHSGVYLPSLVSEEGGEVLVIIDTSGSISESDMVELASECQGIIGSYQVELDVLYVDTEVQGHQRFTSGDIPIKLEPKGGGGTDFRPGFDWVSQHGKYPLCCVYLTDGWCDSFPEKYPVYPVIWVIGGNYACRKFSPPFGEIIRM